MDLTATLVSVEEYLNTSYDPDMEYRNGVLIRRNVGTQSHGALQTIVAAYFHAMRRRFHIRVFTETRLRMDPASGRHTIPDVMLVERPYTKDKVVTDVPAVVIEIKSPDDTFDDIINKCFEYGALGIANIVVIDPDSRRQFVFENQALKLVPALISLHLPKGNVNLVFPVDQMFTELDEED